MVKYPKEFLELCRSVTAKRPRTVIDHILKHGHISTEELKNIYGYNHPPRAARDVKEHGIPIERFTVVGSDGRKIAAYRFADPKKIRFRRIAGRTGLSKQIKEKLIEKYGRRCFIYLEEVDVRELQIDHRVPYEVAGDISGLNPDDFMLLCGSANRASHGHVNIAKTGKLLRKKKYVYPVTGHILKIIHMLLCAKFGALI
ncbi:MAG TPA: HNH endonuclease [Thermodesulfobacteriota bacterium]|nr:HNH endonuclease [Thermodesulfobacteriota bacterium]